MLSLPRVTKIVVQISSRVLAKYLSKEILCKTWQCSLFDPIQGLFDEIVNKVDTILMKQKKKIHAQTLLKI